MVAGLGNPGPGYEQTRHNAGFWFADELARRCGERFRLETRFHGELCRVQVGLHPVWLLKPQTFMNRSGRALGAIANFYKFAPESVLVVHDELDLPPGTVRFKLGGGHAGNNGLRDIHAHLGSSDYRRVRLGIGRPEASRDVIGYVLQKPSKVDRKLIEDAIDQAIDVLPRIVSGEFGAAMNALHSR